MILLLVSVFFSYIYIASALLARFAENYSIGKNYISSYSYHKSPLFFCSFSGWFIVFGGG